MDVILARLWPDHLNEIWMLVFTVWRFLIIIFALIVLFMQEGSTTYTIMLGIVIAFMFMDSIWAFGSDTKTASIQAWYSHNGAYNSFRGVAVLVGRALAVVLPLFVAGGTKNRKSRGWAILASLFSAGYLVMVWFMYMR